MRQKTNLNWTGSCSYPAKNVQIYSFLALHFEFSVDLFSLKTSLQYKQLHWTLQNSYSLSNYPILTDSFDGALIQRIGLTGLDGRDRGSGCPTNTFDRCCLGFRSMKDLKGKYNHSPQDETPIHCMSVPSAESPHGTTNEMAQWKRPGK